MSLAPPSRRAFLGEARVVRDVLQMVAKHGPTWLRKQPAQTATAQPIMILPGFGSGDAATWPLRRFLRAHGFAAEGWGLGLNMAGENLSQDIDWDVPPDFVDRGELSVPRLCDAAKQRVCERATALGQKITLIGWSLGGYVAREVARDAPEAVQHVITLGSPVYGGPKYTAAAPWFKRRGIDIDWIEQEVLKRDARPITVPVTAIVSPSDGIVSYAAASDRSHNTQQIDVDVSHMGMGFRPDVWEVILAQLHNVKS